MGYEQDVRHRDYNWRQLNMEWMRIKENDSSPRHEQGGVHLCAVGHLSSHWRLSRLVESRGQAAALRGLLHHRQHRHHPPLRPRLHQTFLNKLLTTMYLSQIGKIYLSQIGVFVCQAAPLWGLLRP